MDVPVYDFTTHRRSTETRRVGTCFAAPAAALLPPALLPPCPQLALLLRPAGQEQSAGLLPMGIGSLAADCPCTVAATAVVVTFLAACLPPSILTTGAASGCCDN